MLKYSAFRKFGDAVSQPERVDAKDVRVSPPPKDPPASTPASDGSEGGSRR